MLSIIHKKGPAVNACFRAPAPPKNRKPRELPRGEKETRFMHNPPGFAPEGKTFFFTLSRSVSLFCVIRNPFLADDVDLDLARILELGLDLLANVVG